MTESILSSTAFKLHQATLLIDRVADDYLRREHDLRYPAFLVLLMARVNGECNQQLIATSLGVSRASITQRVTPLVSAELLDVVPDPRDSRANLVRLTERGMALIDAAWHGLDRHQSGLEDGVDDAALAAQLDRLIDNGRRILGVTS